MTRKTYITFSENNYIGTKKIGDYFGKLSNTFISESSIKGQLQLNDWLNERYLMFFNKLYTDLKLMLKI